LKWKLLALFSSAICLLLIAGVCIGLFLSHRQDIGFSSLDAPTVLAQVTKLNQLTTVKYSIQRVVGMKEATYPLGEESILLMVQGQALAGVDLSTLSPADVRVAHIRKVTLRLPPAKLFHVFLDEKQTKVWDRHITWWTPWIPFDPDLEHKARLAAQEDVRAAALKMGILDEAHSNAETAIRGFLQALHVDVQFTCD
jgi:hypothetical protein